MASRDFKGIWIDREVWLHPGLKWYDKIVLMEVDSFTQRDTSCFLSDAHLAEFVGVSERTIRGSINRLCDLKLLERSGFDGRKRFLRSLLPTRQANFSDQVGENCRPDRREMPSKKTKNKPKNKPDIVSPWEEKEFLDLWETWKQDRAERKIRKYTPRGEQGALHKLYNECQGDMKLAIETIQNSIANGYQGLFPKMDKSKRRNTTSLDREAVDAWLNS